LLVAWSGGDSHALDQLMPAVYEELKRIARYRAWSMRPALVSDILHLPARVVVPTQSESDWPDLR
jgi:hypothetical protein